jgi:hypothetical protein
MTQASAPGTRCVSLGPVNCIKIQFKILGKLNNAFPLVSILQVLKGKLCFCYNWSKRCRHALHIVLHREFVQSWKMLNFNRQTMHPRRFQSKNLRNVWKVNCAFSVTQASAAGARCVMSFITAYHNMEGILKCYFFI